MLTKQKHIFNRKLIIFQAHKSIPIIARKLKMTPAGVHMTITGDRTCEKTQKKICRVLRVKKEIFWPEFYGGNGNDPVSHDAKIIHQAGAVN